MKTPDANFDRDAKLDGLGLGLMSLLGALLNAVAELHPERDALLGHLHSASVDTATSIAGVAARDMGTLEAAAMRSEALAVIEAVLGATTLARNDNGADHVGEIGPGQR